MLDKTILVIPGSAWQIPIVKAIKSMGMRALVVNPYDNSPAFEYADDYLKADMFDSAKVLNYAKQNNVDAIVSEECDIAMPALAEYGQSLGLSVISKQAAHLFTDKYAMRDFCKECGIPSPEYMLCKTVQEAIDFYHTINKKMIIKPLDSNSSRGVFTIECEKDIIEHFDEALSFSRIEKAVIVERYIDGVEFTVDGIKTPNKHYCLAISQKHHFKHNENIASQLYFTHTNANFDYDLLRATNDKFVDSSNLEFGLTHAEYKYEDGKFYLIEIAARGGGNLISSHIVPFMSGTDNYRYLIDCSLGNVRNEDFTINKDLYNKCSVLKFFETPKNGGVAKEIKGIDILNNDKRIVEYKFNFELGDNIEPAKNDASRVGFYIACCESKQELDELIKDIEDNVKIIVD